MNKPPLRPRIRWMIRRDLPACLAIEEQSFEFPWTEEDFVRVLRHPNTIGMVAEIGPANRETVAGFFVYELLQSELHVLDFAVDRRFRREGIGAAMVEKLASKLSYGRRDRIVLEVRETNLDAQKFFAKCGFRATRVIRDFWREEDTVEDAYAFRYDYQPEQSEAERILSERKAVGQ